MSNICELLIRVLSLSVHVSINGKYAVFKFSFSSTGVRFVGVVCKYRKYFVQSVIPSCIYLLHFTSSFSKRVQIYQFLVND